jgi:hypothetical protein
MAVKAKIAFPVTPTELKSPAMRKSLTDGVAISIRLNFDDVMIEKIGGQPVAAFLEKRSLAESTAIQFTIISPSEDAAQADMLIANVQKAAESGSMVAAVQNQASKNGVLTEGLKTMPKSVAVTAEKSTATVTVVTIEVVEDKDTERPTEPSNSPSTLPAEPSTTQTEATPTTETPTTATPTTETPTTGNPTTGTPTTEAHQQCPIGKYEIEVRGSAAKTCAPLAVCATNQYESEPPTSKFASDGSVIGFLSNRKCTALATCSPETQFESTSAAASSDRACSELTTCADGQFESKPPTTTSNRECSPHTLCDFSEDFQMAEGTTTTNTKCNPLTICTPQEQYQTTAPNETSDRTCADLVICTADEYQVSTDDNGNRKCETLTKCSTTQYESVAPTGLSDRGCEEEIVCGDQQSKSGTGKGAVCVVARFEKGGNRRQLQDQYWNTCESGQYTSAGTKKTQTYLLKF